MVRVGDGPASQPVEGEGGERSLSCPDVGARRAEIDLLLLRRGTRTSVSEDGLVLWAPGPSASRASLRMKPCWERLDGEPQA